MQRFCKPKVGSSILSTGTNNEAPPACLRAAAPGPENSMMRNAPSVVVLCVIARFANAQIRGDGWFDPDEGLDIANITFGWPFKF